MHHQNFSDGCHLFPYDLIYEDLLILYHHELDENRSTHDEEHHHHELVLNQTILFLEHGHHVEDENRSTHDEVHDHHVQDVLVSTLCEELCHHAEVFQESTLYEVILNLNLHENRFHLCERYGQQMILLNQMESIQDDHQRFVLDDRYAVHG